MFVKKELDMGFREFKSITQEISHIVAESGVKEGICTIVLPNEEMGLAITSFWDEKGIFDLFDEIERNIPARVNYKNQFSPLNAAGKVKGAAVGRSTAILIHNGKPLLGSSQGVVVLEFDGPRRREYYVQVEARELVLVKHELRTCYMGMHDLTPIVKEIVRESGIRDGSCHISQLHSTAGLLLGSSDLKKQTDLMDDMERLVPTRADFKHRETASDAGGHVKTAITGSQISLAVKNGELALGTEMAVIFAEFDGPRPRACYIGVLDDQKGGGKTWIKKNMTIS